MRIFPTAGWRAVLASVAIVHPYPHVYTVAGRAVLSGSVQTSTEGPEPLPVAPPMQFDGPGNLWSPETLLCAAVADCLILTFRGISRASKLQWQQIDCHTEGVLERVGGVSRFTRFTSHVVLTLPAGVDAHLAQRVLEKSEHGCLIANSLNATRELKIELRTASAAA
jgi:organic hydroperoxide reductase OsmC/OhrA